MNFHTATQDRATVLPIVVLASGSGTLLQAIIDHQVVGDFVFPAPASMSTCKGFKVVGVVSDVECPALSRAEQAGIPHQLVPFQKGDDREAWNVRLAEAVASYEPQLVVSAGFMRILGSTFLNRFHNRVINTHPALLPAFPGAHAVRDALAYGVKVTGSTIHWVDEGVDTGKIIAQRPVTVQHGEDESALHERIKQVERELIVSVLESAVVVMGADGISGEVSFTYE